MLSRKWRFEHTATGNHALLMNFIGRGIRCMHNPKEGQGTEVLGHPCFHMVLYKEAG